MSQPPCWKSSRNDLFEQKKYIELSCFLCQDASFAFMQWGYFCMLQISVDI